MKYIDLVTEKIENCVCIITFAVMLVLTFINVVSRFVLHLSMSFTEEIVTTLFVLASLCGSSLAIRNQTHLGLDFVTGYMPAKTQKILEIIGIILALVFCGIIFYYGVKMVHHEFIMQQKTATMQWPEWLFGLTVPVGSFLMIVRYILSFIKKITAVDGKEAV